MLAALWPLRVGLNQRPPNTLLPLKTPVANGGSLIFFFQNVERWGPQAERFLAPHPAHVIGVAEHHLPEGKLAQVIPRLDRHNAFATPASPSERSSEGTQAGTMILANKELPVAPLPAEIREAAAPAKHFMRWSACEVRVRGASILFLVAYFSLVKR